MSGLKRQFLLVDKMSLLFTQPPIAQDPDYDFLESSGVLEDIQPEVFSAELHPDWAAAAIMKLSNESHREPGVEKYGTDLMIRILASAVSKSSTIQTVPLCEHRLPPFLEGEIGEHASQETTLHITIKKLPTPGTNASWQDILDFKAEEHDKEWALRRFLNTLSTKRQTQAEIRDDIEWCLSEYEKAMRILDLKASHGFMDAYVIPAIEIVEDLAKFNWSKLAKGVLSAKKRKIELLEAEMRAPGRECAYVVDARKRFGSN